jgi:hypothetical protein
MPELPELEVVREVFEPGITHEDWRGQSMVRHANLARQGQPAHRQLLSEMSVRRLV